MFLFVVMWLIVLVLVLVNLIYSTALSRKIEFVLNHNRELLNQNRELVNQNCELRNQNILLFQSLDTF